MVAGFVLATTLFTPVFSDAAAQDNLAQSTAEEPISHTFVKKHYSIDGQAKILRTDKGIEIVFSETFATRSGPDLKVYLSKLPLSELEDTSVTPNSLKIGVLKSREGKQSYVLPETLSLKDYKSVVIHCEAFSKIWGGFDL